MIRLQMGECRFAGNDSDVEGIGAVVAVGGGVEGEDGLVGDCYEGVLEEGEYLEGLRIAQGDEGEAECGGDVVVGEVKVGRGGGGGGKGRWWGRKGRG